MSDSTGKDGAEPLLTDQPNVEQLRRVAIDVLTAIATGATEKGQAEANGAAGPTWSDGVDFAEALAGIVAAVAANVGSIERLLARRPGSWESGLVHQLVAGTVGEDYANLLEHRTVEVVVPLNVLDLAWQEPAFPNVETALDDAYDVAASQGDEHAETDAEDAVLTAYATVYASYAQAFADAAVAAAAQMRGLRVPVRVVALHDPRQLFGGGGAAIPDDPSTDHVSNPDDLADAYAVDPLVMQLWESAFLAVPIPSPPDIEIATPRRDADAATSDGSS